MTMKLIFIRHADPDYSIDSLTETGFLEAEALAPRVEKMKGDHFYVSPLGRAKKTCEIAMKNMDEEVITLDWLREFPAKARRPEDPDHDRCCWDWLPSIWAHQEAFYDERTFADHPVMEKAHVREIYEDVIKNFDAFLREHGYRKDGKIFRVEKGNHDTLVFFCHFGIECVFLSYLINCSPMLLWHGFVAAPSSVTEVYTEEREEGIAAFRITSFGDTSHLYAKDMEPSLSARFCECYEDDTRHL